MSLTSLFVQGRRKAKGLASFLAIKKKPLTSKLAIKKTPLESRFASPKKPSRFATPSSENTVRLSEYKYQQAKNARLPSSVVNFRKRVSNIKLEKALKQKLAKKEVILRSGGKKNFQDVRKDVEEIIKKGVNTGLNGRQVKEKLVKKYGYSYQDAEKITLATTHFFYSPPEEGLPPERVKALIRQSRMASELHGSMAANIKKGKTKESIKQRTKDDYTRLGISDVKGHKASISGRTISLDESRASKKKNISIQATVGEVASAQADKQMGEGATASIREKISGQKAERVAAAVGVKKKEEAVDDYNVDVKSKTAPPIILSGGSEVPRPEPPKKRLEIEEEVTAETIPLRGGVVSGGGQVQSKNDIKVNKKDLMSFLRKKYGESKDETIAVNDYKGENKEKAGVDK
jgi:hypothetical protein